MPASSAAPTTFCVCARSSRMPKLLQPNPAAENHVAILRRNVQRLDARHAVEIAHVERIVAAEQDMLRAGRRDQELERALVVKDRVIEQPADRFLRAVREIDLGLGADLEAV